MSAHDNSSDQTRLPLWRSRFWAGHRVVVVAACLLLGCVSVRAEDAKPTDHIQTPAAQQKAMAKDGKATTHSGPNAECKIKPDDPAMRTNPAALPAEGDGQERMSRSTDKPSSGESLTLQTPSGQDWMKDQIHLSIENSLGEESRKDNSENSTPGSDPKCTTREAAPKTELLTPK